MATLLDAHDFYDPSSLVAGKTKINLRHRAQAELARLCSDIEHVGFVLIPASEKECDEMKKDGSVTTLECKPILSGLTAERTDDADRQEVIMKELNRLPYLP